ncbi:MULTISPECIES: Imm49 family immunity protein [unclassified Leptotrichia]|uniref:Imm49 family immunity protein n=1 Tax=unclassified Leptotrichia TaxID=2633022 RepID=UPI0004057C8A|nr:MULTISPECIES: Imm49 family immunity protein [unclassified Leptotrichia]WLD75184.1 Imm49 family immunity protein [Leptotrichia sp. HMT-225]
MKNILAGEKKYEKGISLISSFLRKEEDFDKDELKYIENKKGDQFACMWTLSNYYNKFSSIDLVIEKNIKKHRLNCHIGGKLLILGCSRSNRLFTQASQMFEMFMSNNPDFITFFKNNIDMIMPDDYDSKKNKYGYLKNDYGTFFLIRVILHAIRGDFEEVKKRCAAYLEKPLKDSYYKYGELHYEFLKALAEKNIDGMKKAIDGMMEQKVARKFSNDNNPNYEFYLHVYVIIYAKIALYHGIDLEIDNEVAPKELIDITPLEKYKDPYDFMKDFDLATVTPKEWKEWKNSWNLNF